VTACHILCGHALDVLKVLPDQSVHCIVTSSPYWGLRDYGLKPQAWGGDPKCEHEWSTREMDIRTGTGGNWQQASNGDALRTGRPQTRFKGDCKAANECETITVKTGFCSNCGAWLGSHGLEPTPELYIEHSVMIFHEARRVLRDDGTLWLNIGDSYATGAGKVGNSPGGGDQGKRWKGTPRTHQMGPITQPNRMRLPGLKPKDLVGIPWMLAFALRNDGWWLRQDIIWQKPNPMPESVTDRCTKAHEYIFLLTKSARYYYDAAAIEEDSVGDHIPGNRSHKGKTAYEQGAREHRTKVGLVAYAQRQRKPAGWDTSRQGAHGSFHRDGRAPDVEYTLTRKLTRNKRSVWTVATAPFPEAHFATFPPELIEPCILAGCPEGGVVLDPFGGAGTTGLVASRLNRGFILIELNPLYCEMARRRIKGDAPLLIGNLL